jgi:hypothetical protein
MLETVQEVIKFVGGVAGANPAIIIAVFVFSKIIISVTKVKEYFDHDEIPVALIVISVGMGVTFVTAEYDSYQEYMKSGLQLAGVSSILYQVFKPSWKIFSEWFVKKLEKMTGVELEEVKHDEGSKEG